MIWHGKAPSKVSRFRYEDDVSKMRKERIGLHQTARSANLHWPKFAFGASNDEKSHFLLQSLMCFVGEGLNQG